MAYPAFLGESLPAFFKSAVVNEPGSPAGSRPAQSAGLRSHRSSPSATGIRSSRWDPAFPGPDPSRPVRKFLQIQFHQPDRQTRLGQIGQQPVQVGERSQKPPTRGDFRGTDASPVSGSSQTRVFPPHHGETTVTGHKRKQALELPPQRVGASRLNLHRLFPIANIRHQAAGKLRLVPLSSGSTQYLRIAWRLRSRRVPIPSLSCKCSIPRRLASSKSVIRSSRLVQPEPSRKAAAAAVFPPSSRPCRSRRRPAVPPPGFEESPLPAPLSHRKWKIRRSDGPFSPPGTKSQSISA